MDISIIIPCYNNARKLKMALKYLALQENVKPNKIQIIIVDDGSAEDINSVVDEFKNEHPDWNVKLIKNPANMGLAASRNVGARASNSDLLLFIDNDIVMSPRTLYSHIKLHNSSKGIMVTSRIFDVDKSCFDDIMQELNSTKTFPQDYLNNHLCGSMDPYFSIREAMLNSGNVSPKSMWVLGACFCISMPKTIYEQAGGFDENFKGWGPEDIEFNYRAFKAGFNLTYCPQAVCYHLDNCRKKKDQLIFDLSRNIKYFYNKYKSKDIQNFMKFYKGSISFEELDAYLNGKTFKKDERSNLHSIGILRFINSK